ncbi:MAG: NUMOD3 domain-containing DNA-binding protein [Candidatus Gribaldobacteria bacterium]|nr:NUMOD3 domain-containing DNA-binding protein [Candidatus Gribaldobacteria bacterium]
MLKDFYHSKEYREKQSKATKEGWKRGVFIFHKRREKRVCAREECKIIFETIPSASKIYCSSKCSEIINNVGRGPLSIEVKLKISQALKGRKNSHGGIFYIFHGKQTDFSKGITREGWYKKRY